MALKLDLSTALESLIWIKLNFSNHNKIYEKCVLRSTPPIGIKLPIQSNNSDKPNNDLGP